MITNQTTTNKPKVVVIGGGTGLSVILSHLKNRHLDITAIVGVADDGGSSGKLRQITKGIPPGDIRNVLVALSELPERYKEIFQYRFKKGDDTLAGHALGNLIIAAMAELNENYYEAIQLLSRMMMVDGKVLPSAEIPLTLSAHFVDNTKAEGETTITQLEKKIASVSVKPSNPHEELKAGRKVMHSIKEADLIVLGPGSLYTSILPNLLIPEVGDAIVESRAKVLYICNIMTQKGETEGFTDADHVHTLNKHLGQAFIDIVLVNNEIVPSEYFLNPTQDENLLQVEHDFDGLRQEVAHIISDNFLELRDDGVFHNGDKVAREVTMLAKNYQRILKSYESHQTNTRKR